MFETERFDEDGQHVAFATINPFTNCIGQFVNAGARCIDNKIGSINDGCKQTAFAFYCQTQFGATLSEGMSPSRFTVSFQ